MLDLSGSPPAVRSPSPRSKGGRSFSTPDLPTFSVRGKWFCLSRTMDAWQAVRLFGAPLLVTAFAQRWCGEPAYRHPLYHSPPRHLYATMTSPRRCPPQSPVALHADPPLYPPATVSCHPGEHLSSHVTSVPGPHHDVMLTSSAEKRQMHTFAKFNDLND